MKHMTTREGDEYACTCGLRWDVHGPDPHDWGDPDPVRVDVDPLEELARLKRLFEE